MNVTRLKVPTLVLAVVALVVGVSGGAVGAKLITGNDIKNGTIGTKDLKKGAVTSPKIKDGTVAGPDIKKGAISNGKLHDGSVGPNKLSQAAKDSLKTTFAGPNWSVVDRNVIGNGDSYLRAGPSAQLGNLVSQPPMGVGSLGIRTGSPDDKAAFGNQVDFGGDLFSNITTLKYSVFATGEDLTAPGSLSNTPSISFEVDFDPGPGLDFHSVFYQPTLNLTDANQWTAVDAVADTTAHWGITRVAAGTTCDANGTLCTFAELQAFLAANAPDTAILTVQFSKGRDFAFSGAVDALQINTDVFDFEPLGVVQTTAAALKHR